MKDSILGPCLLRDVTHAGHVRLRHEHMFASFEIAGYELFVKCRQRFRFDRSCGIRFNGRVESCDICMQVAYY